MTAIATGQIPVSTTAVQIVAARAGRTQLRLFGLGTLLGIRVLVGHDNTVTAANGYFEAGSLVLATDGAVWGITSAGRITVSFLEIY